MRRLIIILLLQLLGTGFIFGQTINVTGKLTDSTGAPVSGASVVITGTKKGTTTNANGEFTIQAASNETLTISAVGYDAMVVAPGASLSLQMKRNSNQLNEVVVTALGIRKEKKALGYAVSTVDKKILEQRPDGDIGRLLTGKAPGVDVLASSGISGSGTKQSALGG
jgi:outer membrane cobalamin receptor